jgi:predicted permease
MFTSLRLRLRALFRRRQLERDLEDELAFHLAMKAGKLGSEEAARRQFGNVTWFRETCRELWSLGRLETFWQDIRYGARMLRRSPAFTAVAVLSLALGIGANTLIFSFINAVLLKSLPVRDPQELRVITWTGWCATVSNFFGSMQSLPSGQNVAGSFSYPVYRAFRDRAAAFSDIFAFQGVDNVSVVYRGQAFTSYGLIASGNLFSGLGAQPLFGRTITPEDDRPGAPPVAVVTQNWWERYAGLDPAILGQSVRLNGAAYTIVGVMPRDFTAPLATEAIDVYVLLSSQPQFMPGYPLGSSEHWWLQVMARLKPGADDRRAHAELETLFVPMAQKIGRAGIALEDGRNGPLGVRQRFKLPLFLLMGVVGLVLVIACANLASLLLARNAARRHEMALRVAMGAGRLRLIRQSVTESLLVSLAGGGIGLVLALIGRTPVLNLGLPTEGELRLNVQLDLRILAFTFGVSIAAALLFGLIPALRASHIDPASGLKAEPGRAAPRLRLGKVLVAAQVSLSLLLLVGAGLLLRTLMNYWRVDPDRKSVV